MRQYIVCFLVVVVVAGPMDASGDDGETLDIHDVGEYAAVPWTRPGAEIARGSTEDRVKDLNFSVASVNLNGEISKAFLARWAEKARWGQAQGKVFLPRVYFWDGKDRFEGAVHDVEVYWRRMDTFLAAMPLEAFYGIVLAEENVPGGGRAALLSELYRRIKRKYDVRVYQWWSPSGAVPTWSIPSDGWVIDEYYLGGQRFRRIVQRYLVTGAPLVVMPYAAWSRGEKPWPPVRWRRLDEQLQVCREYNLPTAFFWVYNTGCHFGLGEGTSIDAISARVLEWTKEVQSLPADFAGLPSADVSRGDGLEIAPFEGGRLVFADSFDTSQFIEDADIEGFRHLLWERSRRVAVRSWNGEKPGATLTYRFAGDFPADDIEASVAVPFLAEGSRVTLGVSADGGETWPHSAASDGPAPQTLSISTGSDARFQDCRAFRVRVTVEGEQTDGAPVARIDDVRVAGGLSIPSEPAIQLKPSSDDAKHLVYQDDFQTQKFRYSAKVSQLDKLEWRRGSISVRMQPGGARPELVWKVTSPSPLARVVVSVHGKANNGSLGTNHVLDVSVDGKSWRHGVTTRGLPVDKSGWARHGLVIDTDSDEQFAGVRCVYVRLRMQAGSYEKVHPYRSGIVDGLQIDATAE